MSFALALAIAASWWGSHGVTIPCHPTPLAVTNRQLAVAHESDFYSGAWPYATTGICQVMISPTMEIERKTAPSNYCGAITHELGNIAGIPETNVGNLVTDTSYTIIYDCWHARHWRKLHWGY